MSLTTAEIWERCSAELRRFILRRVHDPDAAEDILQDTFLKIHNNLDRLRDDERFSAWIYQIARNAIADHYRRQKSLVTLPEHFLESTPEPAPAPENEVEQAVISWLKPMVATLPPKYREALWLAEFEGITQKELAERLGLSYSGAKSRVQRGRALLKQRLQDCCTFEFDRRGAIIAYRPLQPANLAEQEKKGSERS